MWRKVLSLPQTRLGWWAIGLTAGSALLLIFGAFLVGFGASPWVGSLFLAGLLGGVAGTVVALIALLRGPDRSALVWLSMVAGLPAIPPLGFIFIVLVDGLGERPTLLVIAALVVLISGPIAWLGLYRSGKPR
jgi:hypothetical protein